MTNFSPGPWKVCGMPKKVCSCGMIGVPEHPICTVESGPWGDTWPAIRLVGDSSFDRKAEAFLERMDYGTVDPEVAKANAHLIAAAPDLYAALEEVVDRVIPLKTWHPSMRSTFERIEGVLKKARGEQ